MHRTLISTLFPTVGLAMALSNPAHAELRKMGESELSAVSGQSGISIVVNHLRVNAYDSGSVDDAGTPVDESDGRQKNGYKWDYITKSHAGGGETHLFVDDVSLAMDMTGAITLDIEEDGALVVGLPDAINYVGDGLTLRNIYLNETGLATGGGKLLNEINIRGNFNTGGTVRMWTD